MRFEHTLHENHFISCDSYRFFRLWQLTRRILLSIASGCEDEQTDEERRSSSERRRRAHVINVHGEIHTSIPSNHTIGIQLGLGTLVKSI